MQDLKSRFVKIFVQLIANRDRQRRERCDQSLSHYSTILDATRNDIVSLGTLRRRLRNSKMLTPQNDTLIDIFIYLLVAEGAVCNLLNLISYLLVATGHDLYSQTRRKYVKDDMDEIRKVEMSTKIQFLEYHGFGALVKEYDSTFRNDIAHHNFTVDEKGTLTVRGDIVSMRSKMKPMKKLLIFARESVQEIREGFDARFEALAKKRAKVTAHRHA